MSVSNYSEKKFWINEYGLLLFRNKHNKDLVLKRPYHWCEDNYLVIDEGKQNLIVQTPKLYEINFKDWIPITKEEYEEEKMKNNIKPSNESKGSYVPTSSPLPPPAPFITGMQKVEGPTSDSYEQYRKEMDQAAKDYEEHFKNPDTYGVNPPFDSFNTPYFPEKWTVKKDTIYAAIQAVEHGLEYAKECLEQHNLTHDIFSRKDREWKRMVEKDIKQMENALKLLRREPTK